MKTEEVDKAMIELSKQLPVDAVRQMELVLKKFFVERNVPWSRDTLMACISIMSLTTPQIPPMYSEFMQTAVLLLYRLVDEQITGLVASGSDLVMPTKKKGDEPDSPKN